MRGGAVRAESLGAGWARRCRGRSAGCARDRARPRTGASRHRDRRRPGTLPPSRGTRPIRPPGRGRGPAGARGPPRRGARRSRPRGRRRPACAGRRAGAAPVAGSRLASGSSTTYSRGRSMSAPAIASSWRSPPESAVRLAAEQRARCAAVGATSSIRARISARRPAQVLRAKGELRVDGRCRRSACAGSWRSVPTVSASSRRRSFAGRHAVDAHLPGISPGRHGGSGR